MGKQLKSHPASLKFKVVLESFTTNNVAETARKYGIHANQLSIWRSYFQDQGPSMFQTDASKRERELEKQVATLEQLLSKKELEIQLLKVLGFLRPASRQLARYARARVSQGTAGVNQVCQLLGKSREELLSQPGARRALSGEISRLATGAGSAH